MYSLRIDCYLLYRPLFDSSDFFPIRFPCQGTTVRTTDNIRNDTIYWFSVSQKRHRSVPSEMLISSFVPSLFSASFSIEIAVYRVTHLFIDYVWMQNGAPFGAHYSTNSMRIQRIQNCVSNILSSRMCHSECVHVSSRCSIVRHCSPQYLTCLHYVFTAVLYVERV